MWTDAPSYGASRPHQQEKFMLSLYVSGLASRAPGLIGTVLGRRAGVHFLLVLLLAAPAGLPTDELPAVTDAPQQQQSQAQPKDPDKTADEKKPETPPHTGIRALLDGLRLDIAHLPSMTNLY